MSLSLLSDPDPPRSPHLKAQKRQTQVTEPSIRRDRRSHIVFPFKKKDTYSPRQKDAGHVSIKRTQVSLPSDPIRWCLPTGTEQSGCTWCKTLHPVDEMDTRPATCKRCVGRGHPGPPVLGPPSRRGMVRRDHGVIRPEFDQETLRINVRKGNWEVQE